MITPAISKTVLRLLSNIAADADLSAVNLHISFHDQFEIDSIDYLNLMMALEEEFQVTIPDLDYPKLSTLQGCVEYLAEKLNRIEKLAS